MFGLTVAWPKSLPMARGPAITRGVIELGPASRGPRNLYRLERAIIRNYRRIRVTLRVTFDTNTLDPITQPELAGPMRADCMTIHESLQSKCLEGFFCETVLTVEGGQQPPRPETVARVRRALELGLRILSAPRAGGTPIEALDSELYAKDVNPLTRLERYEAIAAAIEARGSGFARVLEVARSLSHRADFPTGLPSIDRASSPRDMTKVARAVAEWADGDSVAAHFSYANDLFCTEDRAGRAGRYSILHPAQRSWLHRVYGVEFVSIAELAARLRPAMGRPENPATSKHTFDPKG